MALLSFTVAAVVAQWNMKECVLVRLHCIARAIFGNWKTSEYLLLLSSVIPAWIHFSSRGDEIPATSEEVEPQESLV